MDGVPPDSLGSEAILSHLDFVETHGISPRVLSPDIHILWPCPLQQWAAAQRQPDVAISCFMTNDVPLQCICMVYDIYIYINFPYILHRCFFFFLSYISYICSTNIYTILYFCNTTLNFNILFGKIKVSPCLSCIKCVFIRVTQDR